MSKIISDYFAIPKRLLKNKCYKKDLLMIELVEFIFDRLSNKYSCISFSSEKKIYLEPLQFMFGLISCSKKTGLTVSQIRTRIEILKKEGFIQKDLTKTTNKYTIYSFVYKPQKEKTLPKTIYFEEKQTSHSQIGYKNPQLKQTKKPAFEKQAMHQHLSCKNPQLKQTKNSNDLACKLRNNLEEVTNKSHHSPLPLSSNFKKSESLTDDLFLSEKKEDIPLVQIHPEVFISNAELQECIKVKGSLEEVKRSIEFIQSSPKRTAKIKNWARTLMVWEIKSPVINLVIENENIARNLCNKYPEFDNISGYRCYIYHDNNKDQKGLIFENESPYIKANFIPFTDREFSAKSDNFIKQKIINCRSQYA